MNTFLIIPTFPVVICTYTYFSSIKSILETATIIINIEKLSKCGFKRTRKANAYIFNMPKGHPNVFQYIIVTYRPSFSVKVKCGVLYLYSLYSEMYISILHYIRRAFIIIMLFAFQKVLLHTRD